MESGPRIAHFSQLAPAPGTSAAAAAEDVAAAGAEANGCAAAEVALQNLPGKGA